jgi:hypothetical protein
MVMDGDEARNERSPAVRPADSAPIIMLEKLHASEPDSWQRVIRLYQPLVVFGSRQQQACCSAPSSKFAASSKPRAGPPEMGELLS